jgi:hypothetical protein
LKFEVFDYFSGFSDNKCGCLLGLLLSHLIVCSGLAGGGNGAAALGDKVNILNEIF